jgi:hypothetical protein
LAGGDGLGISGDHPANSTTTHNRLFSPIRFFLLWGVVRRMRQKIIELAAIAANYDAFAVVFDWVIILSVFHIVLYFV